ncbi:MAG: ShlB/FhaC/HecB family hemolysin secretion/activation protein [Mariprofundus sp.]|nr:ShlB/FhaC/HecB family hemolysin secretion/activation protein [Mariprofundus sp.]
MRLFFPIVSGLLCLCAPTAVLAVQAEPSPATVSKITLESRSSNHDGWIKLGWNQIADNHPEAALAIWQQGINRLPPEQLLAFVGLYSHLSDATKQLKRIGPAEKAIILYSNFKGAKAYYVLSAQDVPVDHKLRMEKLANLTKILAINGTIFANAASKFQLPADAFANNPARAHDGQPSMQTMVPVRSNKNDGENIAGPDALANGPKPAVPEKSPVAALASKNMLTAGQLVDGASIVDISSDWVEQGWQQLDQGDADAALAIWQQGVNSIPSKRLLAFLGVYFHMTAAIRQLKRAGMAEKAIILHADFKGKKAYYVMSAGDIPADKSIRREKLASLHQAIKATGILYANAAGKFQTEKNVAVAIPVAGTFTIKAFKLIGNTLIADDVFQKALKPYTGENRTREDLVAAKQAILRLYRDAGYEMVAVGLPRKVKAETVPIRVFEARIGKVWVSGGGNAIKTAMSALKTGETANADMLDDQLREISRMRNVKSAQLVYHPTDKGVVDVEILVDKENPMKIGLMASSLGTQETGQTLFTGIFYHDNLWNAGHKLTISYTVSEKVKNLHLYSAMYQVPVEALDGKLILSASRADVASGQVLGVLNSRGNGTLKSIHYEQTIFRTSSSRHYLDIGYEQHLFNERFTNIALPVAFSIGILANPVVFGYGFESNTGYGEFNLHADYYHNTPLGAQKRNATYRLLNPAAFANWSLLRLNANYHYDWESGWSFSGNAGGQISNNALIAGERFYITGLSKVRGFEEVEASGDTAFFLRTQVTSPSWLPDTRFHAFLDAGRYKLNFPFPGEFPSDKIVSTGLGAHWRPAFGLDVMAEAGIVLNSLPVAPKGSMTGHFKVVYWFQ